MKKNQDIKFTPPSSYVPREWIMRRDIGVFDAETYNKKHQIQIDNIQNPLNIELEIPSAASFEEHKSDIMGENHESNHGECLNK